MFSIFKYSEKRNHKSFLVSLLYLLSLFFFISTYDTQAQENPEENIQNVESDETKVSIPDNPQAVAHGRDLFGQHCSACHMIEKQLIGPALASVHGTRPTDWLIRFIKNSQEVISDPEEKYAKQLFSQYNEQIMPAFEFLSDDDILSILAYIKKESISETASLGVGASGNAQSDEGIKEEASSDNTSGEAYAQDGEGANYSILTSSSITVLIIFAVSLVILVVAIFYLSKGINKNKHKTNA